MKRIFISILFCTVALLVACNSDNGNNVDNSDENNEDLELTDVDIITPNNKLGFDLISKVDTDENNNIFISPTSALFALSMAYNGAEEETKEEIANVLHVQDLTVEEVNHAIESYMKMLKKDSEVVNLSIANSLWLHDNFHFTDEFAQDTKDYFQAKTTEIDVNDDRSVREINDWVSEATNDKITEIVDAPLNPDMVAMLINALYFKGTWTYEFDQEQTEESPFYTGNGEMEVPMMMLEESLYYMDHEDFQAVKLPYGEGEMSMQIFLPREDLKMEDFMNDLTEQNWRVWNSELQERDGTVKLPKFSMEYETNVNNTLQQLGMESAFDPEEADFSNMIQEEDPLWISKVKQKTYIDVDEEGTEAAAATSVEMETTSLPVDEDEPFYMEVNRPFFMTIIDEETDAILFIGVIENPIVE